MLVSEELDRPGCIASRGVICDSNGAGKTTAVPILWTLPPDDGRATARLSGRSTGPVAKLRGKWNNRKSD